MKKCVDIFSEDGRLVVKGTGCYETKKVNDLKELIRESVKNYGDSPAFKFKDKDSKIINEVILNLREI